MSRYANISKETKYMNFVIENEGLLTKHKTFQNKIGNIIEQIFDSQPVHEQKYTVIAFI